MDFAKVKNITLKRNPPVKQEKKTKQNKPQMHHTQSHYTAWRESNTT